MIEVHNQWWYYISVRLRSPSSALVFVPRPLGFPISDHLEGKEEEIEGRFGRLSPWLLLHALGGEVSRLLAGGIVHRFETDAVRLRPFHGDDLELYSI